MDKKKLFKTSIKILVSAAFLAWVIYKINWLEVWFYLKKIEWWQILIYILILLLGMFISSYKWKKLADHKGLVFSHWNFFKLYITGTFINNFMPSFVAGDAYKAYSIGQRNEKYAQAASTVMMDRITGLVGAMALAIFFSLINFRQVVHHPVLLWVNLGIILSLFSDVVIAKMKNIPLLRRWAYRVMPQKVLDFLRELYSYNNKTNVLSRSIWLGVLFSIVGVALLNYLLFIFLDVHVRIVDYLSVIFLTSIISSFPISINNIGLKEWAYITFFGFFGVSSSAVVAISVISRFLQMAVSFFALPIYLRDRNKIL